MPNRLRYRLHAMLDKARCFEIEPEPMGSLTMQETPSRKRLPTPSASSARLPVARGVSRQESKAST